jgi:hypothetical protein
MNDQKECRMTVGERFRGGLAAVGLASLLALSLITTVSLASAQDEQPVTVQLDAEDDSGVSGTAVLTADGDQTTIEVSLVGSEEGYEGHSFDSTCDDHASASVFYAIEPVDADGKSTSVVDAPLSELTNGEFWIHLHRPAGERGVGVACGQIPALNAAGGSNLPGTGVGPLDGGGMGNWLLVAASAFAVLLLAMSQGLRRSANGRG